MIFFIGSIIAVLLFLAYISQDYYAIESLKISSLTLRYLPGELQFVQNASINKIEDNEEDFSTQFIDDKETENNNEFYEENNLENEVETDEERFERIGKRQQERIENLEKFCKADARLHYLKATIWYRKG